MASRKESPAKTGLLGEYRMNNKQRGLALIFNQNHFQQELRLRERDGNDADKTNLTERFQELGFEVQSYDDLDEKNMMDSIQKAAKHDHKDADCFVCVFLSHGDEDHIFANDKKVDINRITDLFRGNECESLVGKPKIFIIQASQGKIAEEAVTGMAGDDDEITTYFIPAGADFLICCSVAEVDCNFYIQDLCETLKQQGSTLEFTKLLTLVNMKVSSRTQSSNKQMPCFTSMLTKKLYFRPKEEQMSTPSGSSSIKS
ncbi:caspase-6-like [Astyanax mexicanus]|uniref:Caspase-6 n=1 Tax=Astyanax mexicanus TaxID=7994 RepID=A0A8T2LUN6_ASTMX|nr:caspase-6-like [Astyanax mexicanus]